MASPWKFLSRLVPRRREPKQDDAEVAGGKPDVLALPGPAETVAEQSLAASSARAGAEQSSSAVSDPVSVEPDTIGGAVGEADDATGDVVAGELEPSDPINAVILSSDPADLSPGIEGAARKKRGRTKKQDAVRATTQVPFDVSIPSDTLSLDDEIRVLRGKLAEKLRLQNAQLRKMLERFER
ncbi:hypothetical protein [Neorhizobium sp. DAR64872/K0K18]|uniref:hypothetical protein n=1 Tax=Neorhizobium sp. DAR64872/K0K18 TaxID=3421958 RepID=UPI003D2AAA7C